MPSDSPRASSELLGTTFHSLWRGWQDETAIPTPLSVPSGPIFRASWIMASMGRKTTGSRYAVSASRYFVAACAVLSLAGCGTMTGAQQSCESTFGLAAPKQVRCTGSVETVSGSPSLSVIEVGDDIDGAFLLETTITVGHGTARASVTDTDDELVGGEVSPDEPLKINAVVYPEPAAGADEDTEEVEVQLEIKEGEELKDLRYEATLVEQD
jgi:hypothetical protein